MPLPASKMQMNLEKDRERIDLLLDKLFNTYKIQDPASFKAGSQDASKNCAGAALKSAVDLLSQAKGGRIMLFSGTISQLGVGKVAVRAQAAKINTAEETKAYLTPENTFWSELGEECAMKRIAVDLFVTIPENK